MRYLRLPLKLQLQLLEAVVWLTLARLAILWIPLRRLAPWLGQAAADTGAIASSSSQLKATELLKAIEQARTLKQIGYRVNRVGHRLPWHSSCLVIALAAKAMVARRGYRTTIYFGVAKPDVCSELRDENIAAPSTDDTSFKAHAWLQWQEHIITGGTRKDDFKVIAIFS